MLDAKEAKEREKRRKKYKFALVRWLDGYEVEYKSILGYSWYRNHEILCDDQPEKVLRGMLKLMKENEDE